MRTFLDRQVGLILDQLDHCGLAENTLVPYVSDHGERLDERGLWWKHTFYQGSVGIPMILRVPEIAKGENSHANVSLMDIGPTLLDLADAPALPDVAGRRFRPVIEGRPRE